MSVIDPVASIPIRGGCSLHKWEMGKESSVQNVDQKFPLFLLGNLHP